MSEERKGITQVNIEEAIKSKNPKLYKRLPRFVLNYIKRVTHEKEMNDFFPVHGHKWNLDFVKAVLDYFNIKIEVKGAENIRSTGGVVYASNHPIGSLDALALLEVLGKHRTDLKFIVNDILLQIKNLDGIFVGVNKHGKNANNLVKDLDVLYGSEQAVLIFPAGLVSRKQKGLIRDLEWKKSFITKAKKHQRDIIPVYIHGANSNKFYNLGKWRKRFGIKANIEMFYLIDEMFKQRDKTITIVFGKPVPSSTFDKTHSDLEWAGIMKDQVYAMEKLIS